MIRCEVSNYLIPVRSFTPKDAILLNEYNQVLRTMRLEGVLIPLRQGPFLPSWRHSKVIYFVKEERVCVRVGRTCSIKSCLRCATCQVKFLLCSVPKLLLD